VSEDSHLPFVLAPHLAILATMIIAATGHRPDKLGGYSAGVVARLTRLARTELDRYEPNSVIVGMAQGWDQAVAAACVQADIPFSAYVPFPGQELQWPTEAQRVYYHLLRKAEHIKVCSAAPYSVEKMQYRNECMVDDCTMVMALWNGTPGGTRNCVKYAYSKGVKLINCWPEWLALP